ncbi:MAG: arginine--tRNA ligase [bacterium]|nr:arginine--tRNA ligase [bacterium]
MNLNIYLTNKLKKLSIQNWPELKERDFDFEVNYSPNKQFGDYSSNIAMKLAPVLRRGPLEIAEEIKKEFGNSPALIKLEVVSPGFINFFINNKWLIKQVGDILKLKNKWGISEDGKNQKVQIEFISANPTGPITLGNGRGGFSGDVLGNIMKLAGYRVQKEYYVNDIGNQVSILAESVLRKYWQKQGIKIEYPDYCYQGSYINELAQKLFLPNYKISQIQNLKDVREKIKGRILKRMIADIKKMSLNKFGIKFDKFFEEHTLYSSGTVDRMLRDLKEKKLLYKSADAIWLRTRQFGDEKDRVLIKADGEPVYFLSDIAYHWNKFYVRKFDKVIDMLGADHHGYKGRLQATMKIFEFDGQLDLVLSQFVRLIKNGQEIKMSKRAGNFITLEEVVDEAGIDATRFFFLMHDYNTHMDFDMNLAKKKTKDNPVFYVQYAHARICSILRKAKELEIIPVKRSEEFEPGEEVLIKKLIKWPELIVEVAASYQVNKLTTYSSELATSFHEFYTNYKVIQGKKVNERRLNMIQATQIVLKNVLTTMGISAPERM